MMRIKSSTSGGWAEEGPLVVKRRKSERHQENRERRQGRLREGVPRMESSMSVAALCFVHCMCSYHLISWVPVPPAAGQEGHTLSHSGAGALFLHWVWLFSSLRSAFMWLEASWPLAPPPGSILSGLNPWTKKGTPGPLILLLFWAHFWWRKWD